MNFDWFIEAGETLGNLIVNAGEEAEEGGGEPAAVEEDASDEADAEWDIQSLKYVIEGKGAKAA